MAGRACRAGARRARRASTVAASMPGGRRHRPAVGGTRDGPHAHALATPADAHHERQPADGRPAHPQVARPALVVRRVEHEVDALGGHLLDRGHREQPEDAPALVVGSGRGVDRAHRAAHAAVGMLELPAQERAEADDRRRRARRPTPATRRTGSARASTRRTRRTRRRGPSRASRRGARAPRAGRRRSRAGSSALGAVNGSRRLSRVDGLDLADRPRRVERVAARARRVGHRRPGGPGRRASAMSASARRSGWPGGTSTASFPSVTISATPPTSVATTGRPSASASISAIGSPSWWDARQNMSKADMTRTASGR